MGPVSPVAPVGPCGPWGPAGPVAPVAPVSPLSPLGPGGPAGPCKVLISAVPRCPAASTTTGAPGDTDSIDAGDICVGLSSCRADANGVGLASHRHRARNSRASAVGLMLAFKNKLAQHRHF